MNKKGLSVWITSTLTFIALLHLIDSASALILGNPIKLLTIYPYISDKLATIAPQTYFWISAATTTILWAITCLIVFENPVETFLNNILSDAKTQTAVESQLIENKSEILDAMFETMESNNQTLSQVKDLVCNVRVEAKEIQPLKENVEKIKTELVNLRKEIKKIEDKAPYQNICIACGKPLMPEFNLCPYCGENIKPQKTPVIELKNYK